MIISEYFPIYQSLQNLSHNNRVRLFWVPSHCYIEGNKEADRLGKMGSDSYFCEPEPCVPLSASVVPDINRKRVFDAHSKHWIALNRCSQSKPDILWNYLKNSAEFWFLISTGWDWQQALFSFFFLLAVSSSVIVFVNIINYYLCNQFQKVWSSAYRIFNRINWVREKVWKYRIKIKLKTKQRG
jgi:hypothetical protein